MCRRLGFVLAIDRFLEEIFHNTVNSGISLCRVDSYSADQVSGKMECQIPGLFHIGPGGTIPGILYAKVEDAGRYRRGI